MHISSYDSLLWVFVLFLDVQTFLSAADASKMLEQAVRITVKMIS